MLEQWYFCCCIKASPSSTNAFLSILETLGNRQSDSQMLYLAYSELRRTDSWMQIYALPFVLRSLRSPHLPENQHDNIVRPYIDSLIESSESFTDSKTTLYKQSSLAIRHLFEGIGFGELTKGLEETARRYDSRKADLETSRTPYLDLKDFLPETMMLAIAADLCEQDEDFAKRLASYLKDLDDEDKVRYLIDDALNHQCGRLAFLIGVVLAKLTRFQSRSELKDTFWQAVLTQDHLVFELEPDLMHCYATLLFEGKGNHTTETIAREIIKESWTMDQLSKIPGKTLKSADPLYRVWFDADPEVRSTLPPIYWKCTLWNLAVQIDSNVTASLLAEFWQIPRTGLSIDIKNPLFKKKKGQSNFKWLADLRVRGVNLSYSKSAKIALEDEHRWLFDSPWIERSRKQSSNRDSDWYIKSIVQPGNLIRLISGVDVASKILQNIDDESPVLLTYCSFIGHATDVINKVYGKWLIEHNQGGDEKIGYPSKLNIPLTGITLFSHQQATALGSGRLTSVSPESFVKVLKNYDKYLASEAEEESNPQKRGFLEKVFPEACIAWISDAYPGAVKNSSTERWLPWIPYVYKCYSRSRNHSPNSKREAALIYHFLGNEDAISLNYNEFDWRKPKNELYHRSLLLSPPSLTIEEWNISWDEKEKRIDQSSVLSYRIVRTLQRLQALGREYSTPEEVPEDKRSWLSDWKDYISAVSQKRGLDRFTRLMLLEVIQNRLLQNSEDLKVITYVLLEYGCAYDLQNLIEYIYTVDSDGLLLPSTSAKQELQRAFAQSMFDFAKRNIAELSDINSQRRAQSPREARIILRNAELFNATLSRIVYAVSPSNEDLLRQFNQILEGALQNKCRVGSLRSQKYDVEPRQLRKEIVVASGRSIVDDWSIRGVVFDLNRFSTTLFYDDVELAEDVNNLFTLSKAETEALMENVGTQTRVLAAIVSVSNNPESEDSKFRYVFNCGLTSYFEYSSNDRLAPLDEQFYPYVILTMKWTDRTSVWRVDNAIALKSKLRVGDVKKISHETKVNARMNSTRRKRQPALVLREEGKETQRCENYEPTVWEPNTSALFGDSESEPTNVFSELDSYESWRPYSQDLFGLLLEIFFHKGSRRSVVLTFIEETSSIMGSQQWHFSADIGKNFIVEKQQFTQQAEEEIALQIEDAVAEWNSAIGLLIAVEPVLCDSQIRLQLLRSSVETERLKDDIFDLDIPFDDRNLRWNNLFNESESTNSENPPCIAERSEESDTGWLYRLEDCIPGFPHEVLVIFENPPDEGIQKVDVEVKRWHPTWAILEVEQQAYHEINVKDEKWDDFLDSWLNLQIYSPLCLQKGRSINNSNSNGDVTCLTTENIMVQTEIESLTMQPASLDQRVKIPEKREAEVVVVIEKERLSIDLQPDDIRIDLSQAQRCDGVMARVPRYGEGETYRVIWRTPEETVAEDIVISNLPRGVRITQGSLIKGAKHSKGWTFWIQPRFIRVRALWEIEGSSEVTGNLTYLGVEQKGRPVAEKAPGKLVFLPHLPDSKEHLAKVSEKKSEKASSLPSRMKNITRNSKPWKDAEKGYYCHRAVLQMKGEKILAGDCSTNVDSGQVVLDEVQIRLFERSESLHAIDREFSIE